MKHNIAGNVDITCYVVYKMAFSFCKQELAT